MTEQELHALAQDAFRHGLLTPDEAVMLAGGYIGLRAERDALKAQLETALGPPVPACPQCGCLEFHGVSQVAGGVSQCDMCDALFTRPTYYRQVLTPVPAAEVSKCP